MQVITTGGRTLGLTGTGRRPGVGVEALIMDELAVVSTAPVRTTSVRWRGRCALGNDGGC